MNLGQTMESIDKLVKEDIQEQEDKDIQNDIEFYKIYSDLHKSTMLPRIGTFRSVHNQQHLSTMHSEDRLYQDKQQSSLMKKLKQKLKMKQNKNLLSQIYKQLTHTEPSNGYFMQYDQEIVEEVEEWERIQKNKFKTPNLGYSYAKHQNNNFDRIVKKRDSRIMRLNSLQDTSQSGTLELSQLTLNNDISFAEDINQQWQSMLEEDKQMSGKKLIKLLVLYQKIARNKEMNIFRISQLINTFMKENFGIIKIIGQLNNWIYRLNDELNQDKDENQKVLMAKFVSKMSPLKRERTSKAKIAQMFRKSENVQYREGQQRLEQKKGMIDEKKNETNKFKQKLNDNKQLIKILNGVVEKQQSEYKESQNIMKNFLIDSLRQGSHCKQDGVYWILKVLDSWDVLHPEQMSEKQKEQYLPVYLDKKGRDYMVERYTRLKQIQDLDAIMAFQLDLYKKECNDVKQIVQNQKGDELVKAIIYKDVSQVQGMSINQSVYQLAQQRIQKMINEDESKENEDDHIFKKEKIIMWDGDQKINYYQSRQEYIRGYADSQAKLRNMKQQLKIRDQKELERIANEFNFKDYGQKFNTNIGKVLKGLLGCYRVNKI